MEVFGDRFAFVQYQMFDASATPFGDERWAFYQATYTPLAAFDGQDLVEGAVHDLGQQYTIYRTNHYLPGRAIATDVTLEVSATPISGQTYEATTTVGIEPDGTGKTLRIFTVQVLDNWPATKDYHRNGFKQAVSIKDVALAPGASFSVVNELTFDAESWASQSDIKLIAWAQAPEDQGPAAVYQSAVKHWPLLSAPGDYDGDGEPDGTDNCWRIYNPGQEDGDADNAGDACDNCLGLLNATQTDTDEDTVGDACDNCPVLHTRDQTDTDADEIGDKCDSCPEVTAPAGVDAFGRSRGAIDLDCDVDLDDAALFADCLSGADETSLPPQCTQESFNRSDADGDGDADVADFEILTRNFSGPLPSPALYVGASLCIECHETRHTLWTDTIHHTAFDTLVNDGEGDNVLCFPCHSVGYGKPSGFVDLDTTPHLAGIQCENCHGPGSNHVADPDNEHLVLQFDSDLCGSCHQSCHGLCGENHHPQFEQWSTSKHSTALDDMRFTAEAEDDCLRCHSTDYRLAMPGAEPTLWEAFYAIECVACHNPHGGPHTGQLRAAKPDLCSDCHTNEYTDPGQTPAQPQSEVLHSLAGFKLDGSPLTVPYTEHWWGVADECAACHVLEEPYGGPQQPVNSGHTFEANMRACMPCHSEQTATLLVQMTGEEMNARIAEVARYLDPGDPLYVDPAGLSPQQLDQYNIAMFDYELVVEDRSNGSHNAPYARALLAESEAFFGIAPWPLRQPADAQTAIDALLGGHSFEEVRP